MLARVSSGAKCGSAHSIGLKKTVFDLSRAASLDGSSWRIMRARGVGGELPGHLGKLPSGRHEGLTLLRHSGETLSHNLWKFLRRHRAAFWMAAWARAGSNSIGESLAGLLSPAPGDPR